VRAATTTELTPDEIHRIGLAEVARIRARMEAVKRRAGFEGSLDAFFAHVETTPRLKYPNTPEGRELYLQEARGFVAQAMAAAPRFFHRLPKAPLEVRAVEPWRESTAAIAFYSRGTPDGSRPGIYYANLADMTQVSRAQVETRSYHEGAPGHHFQNAFAQEQAGLPKFRRFGGYGAYGEGWGLYSEKLGKEMGGFKDPYSEFGGLSTELWRAVRLVVDTGLHSKRWSRERAVTYLRDNSLLSERDVNREINRYITNPGQATSYKIGELKISELRARAERELGPRFDVRDFHAVVLDNGSMPLAVLEQQVDGYIDAMRASGSGRAVSRWRRAALGAERRALQGAFGDACHGQQHAQRTRAIHSMRVQAALSPQEFEQRGGGGGEGPGRHAPSAEQTPVDGRHPDQLQHRMARILGDAAKGGRDLAAPALQGLEEPAVEGHQQAGDAHPGVVARRNGHDIVCQRFETRAVDVGTAGVQKAVQRGVRHRGSLTTPSPMPQSPCCSFNEGGRAA
jgi:hypothetical protein